MASIDYLKDKARQWAGLVVNLHNMDVPTDFEPGKQALLKSAKSIKYAIEKITGPLEMLAPMNQLGILPVIIGGVGIAGAVALVTKWTLDYKKFVRKLEERRALVAGGLTENQAAKVVNLADKNDTPLFQIISPKATLYLGGGGFLLWYAKRQGWF